MGALLVMCRTLLGTGVMLRRLLRRPLRMVTTLTVCC